MHSRISTAFILFALAGCAPLAMAPLDISHPASPNASAAPPYADSTVLKNTPLVLAPNEPDQSPSAGHVHGRAAATEAAVYQCPMHPEVRADQPGRCPKCGMELREVHE